MIAGLVTVLRKRQRTLDRVNRLPSLAMVLSLIAFAAVTFGHLVFVLNCGSTEGAASSLAFLASPLRVVMALAALGALVCIAWAYVAGLRGNPPSGERGG